MKNVLHIPAFVLATALMVSPAIAQTEDVAPQILTLPDRADTVLPGDHAGASHGVKINRGSGFPEPVIAVVEPEVEAVVPTPAPPRQVVRRTSRW